MTIKNVTGDGWIYIQKQDEYGGINLQVSAGYLLTQLVMELKAHLDEAKTERLIRESDPTVKLAYDAYKMAIALCSEGA
jgi:hypothetical protein